MWGLPSHLCLLGSEASDDDRQPCCREIIGGPVTACILLAAKACPARTFGTQVQQIESPQLSNIRTVDKIVTESTKPDTILVVSILMAQTSRQRHTPTNGTLGKYACPHGRTSCFLNAPSFIAFCIHEQCTESCFSDSVSVNRALIRWSVFLPSIYHEYATVLTHHP
jgi:hypothetical protein